MTSKSLNSKNLNQINVIYTDGACSGNPGTGGWAYIFCDSNKFIKEGAGVEPNSTNNRMEMTAAIEALKNLAKGDHAILLTDSVYVIRGITQWIFGWQKRDWKNAEGKEILNKDLWQALQRETFGKKIEWRYIPGHKGYVGNERVDELAVAQSLRRPISIYEGSIEHYRFSILPLPEPLPLPEMRKMNGDKKSTEKSFYLSYVNGVLEQHSEWSHCQARVKGVSSAKFKKVSSDIEANETIKSWGLNPLHVVLKR